MATIPPTPRFTSPVAGEPTWDIALLYPNQGDWAEEEYLSLTDSSNQLVEYTEGFLEVLPMPTIEHQLIVRFLLDALRGFVEPGNIGMVLFAPLRVWTRERTYREPDLVFKFAENHAKSGRRYYKGADLVMEVVSDDHESRVRDYERKLADYAQAGIPEYWIVDPQESLVTVMYLEGDGYVAHTVGKPGDFASSKLLPGFTVDVSAIFASAKR